MAEEDVKKMEETKKETEEVKKEEKVGAKAEVKIDKKTEIEEKKTEAKTEKKTETKKKKTGVVEKEVAIANGYSLRISPKYAIAICKVIKGKSPEAAVKRLEDVILEKRVIPMANLEVGHKKGKGIAGAKYPKNACKAIIEVIKQVDANAVVNGIENPVITIARSDRANRPYRRAGRRAKRTHIHLEVKDKVKLIKTKKK